MLKIGTGILLIIFLTGTDCIAQAVHSPVQLPYVGLGAYSNQGSDVFSFTANQAKLATLETAGAGMYGKRKFMLRELGCYSVVAAVPAGSGGLGLQAGYFGFAGYNESCLGLAYGKKLGKWIDIGVQFNYFLIHTAGYGSAGTINFETGILLHPGDRINIGLHVYNPTGGRLGKNTGEKLASRFKAGIGYDASSQVCISAELVKEENEPASLNAGLQYVFAGQFFARIGIISASVLPYGGAGLSWKNLRIDIAVSYQPRLGFTPGLQLIAGFAGKKQQ